MENKKQLMSTDSVFLTKDGFGITTTSANYLANLAKEVIQEKKLAMESISFVNSKLITTECKDGIDYEKACFNLESLNEDIKRIGEINTFIAWMREGIKKKTALMEDVDAFTFGDWLESKDIEMESPKKEEEDEEAYVNSLSVGERLRMIRAEAVAAAYGKMVHPDSPLSKARKSLIDHIVKPTVLGQNYGSPKDFCMTSYTPAVEVEKVDEVFMKLQNEQRNAEKELNTFKFAADESKHQFVISSGEKHMNEMEEYMAKRKLLKQQYETEMENHRHEISLLKILIPDALKETYTYLNGLGK